MKIQIVLFSVVAILMVTAEENVPSVAVQAEPFIAEQAEPFMAEQAEPFAVEQAEPFAVEQAEPFVGEGEVRVMDRNADGGQVESRSADVPKFAAEQLNVPILTRSCSTDTCTYICRLIGFQKGACQSNSSCNCSY